MKILVLGAGKMGSFFIDLLSFDHEVAVFEKDAIVSASPPSTKSRISNPSCSSMLSR